MIRTLTILLITCLAVNLAFTSPGSSVETASESTSAPDLFDLDFPGGTLQEYVDAIRKKVGNANIIVMPEAMNIPMPAIHLSSVEVGGALASLDDLKLATGYQEIKTHLSFHQGNQNLGELDIYTINANIHTYNIMTRVFSVSDILHGKVSERDLLSTIESSLELVSENLPEAKVQFHPETGILIVRGYDAQVDVVNNLLDELHQSARQERSRKEKAAAMENQQKSRSLSNEMQQTISRLNATINQLETEKRTLELELSKLINNQNKD